MTEDEETNRFYCDCCGLFFVLFDSLLGLTPKQIQAVHVQTGL